MKGFSRHRSIWPREAKALCLLRRSARSDRQAKNGSRDHPAHGEEHSSDDWRVIHGKLCSVRVIPVQHVPL